MPSLTVFKGLKDGTIKQSVTEKPELTGDQVLLRVTASGVCGTDLHYKKADIALGHEGVGIIEATGPQCTYMKKGDRVGWGYIQDSCGHCEQCLMGAEVYCAQVVMYGFGNLDQGSFAHHAIWREAFLFPIPDGLTDEDAAPLQCGGTTVFNALHAYNTQPTDVVGVMGVGGLGHMAIQFAAAMGCDVVVISGSEEKKDEAMKLGAKHFIATRGATELKTERLINHLLVTTSALPQWELILPLMAPGGVIHTLSVADGDFVIPYIPLVLHGLRIQGSAGASRYIHRRMLEFAAFHNIKPVLERFPMTEKGIQDAFDKLESGKMRYRGVLVPQ